MPLLDAIPIFGPWRIKRHAKKYEQWCAFVNTQQTGSQVFEIVGIRASYPRKGVKAYGRWLNGQTSALWIEGAWPNVGVFMSAPGSFGHGEHHREEVFYAAAPYYFLDASYGAAARRHVARSQRPA